MKDIFYFNTPLPEDDGLPLFDSHCHLQDSQFDEDREAVIQRARTAGLKYLVVVGYDYKSSLAAINLAKAHPDFIYATVGNHPYEAHESLDECVKLIEPNREYIVAIGETGLDYFRSPIDPETQKKSFKNHCLLANQYDLPVVIHTRPAEECSRDALKILDETQTEKAIFHCFSGTRSLAEEIWNKNYKTSFALNITYPKNKELLEISKDCPPELRLVETDSPYLAPQSKRGQRNEPGELEIIKSFPI